MTTARHITSTTTLADQFRAARATRIEVDGRRVHSVYAIPITGSSLLVVRKRHVTPARPQALRLAAAVDFVSNGHRSRDLVLRSTTMPSRADIMVEADDPTIVYVWNTWTIDHTEHAWLGNAGMLVEYDLTGDNPIVRLQCSDGVGPAAFDDLRIDLEIAPRSVPLAEPATARRAARRTAPAS